MATPDNYMAAGILSPRLGRSPPVVVFPENIKYSDAEKKAIRYHAVGIHYMLNLLSQTHFHDTLDRIGTIILFIDSRLRVAFNPDDENFREFLDELIYLQKEFSKICREIETPSRADIYNIASLLNRNYENLDTLAQGVIANLPQCFVNYGLHANLLAATMHPALKLQLSNLQQAAEITPHLMTSPTDSTMETNNSKLAVSHKNQNKKARTAQQLLSNASVDDEGFQFPRKTAKEQSNVAVPTTTSNSYEILNSMETSENDSDNLNKESATPIKTPDPVNTSEKPNHKSADRPQPIFFKSVKYKDIIEQISNLSEEKFQKKAIDDLIRIMPASIEHFRIIQAFFATNNIEFFAMLPKAERPKKVVIRGLPVDTDLTDIKTELCGLGLAVHRISQMKNFKTKIPYPSVIVDLFKNEALPGVFQLGNLLGYQVTVSNYTSTHVKQCFRCQRFGHSSDICSLEFVCLKCSGNHRSNTCSVPREQIKCYHCGANHCSNFSQCPKNPKMIKNAKLAAIQEAAIIKDSSFPIHKSLVTPGINFAAATAGKNTFRTKNKRQAPPSGQAPPLNQDNYPTLPPQMAGSQTTPTQANAFASATYSTNLDSTIVKLERIRDLLLQIKALSQEVNTIPGLNGLFQSVLGPLA